MLKVVQATDELRRIRLINMLKCRGVSRVRDGRYIEDLTLDELRLELKRVKLNEAIRASKEWS